MKIYIAEQLKDSAIQELKKTCEVVFDPGKWDFDVAFVRGRTQVDKAFLDKAKNLKLVIRGGVGLDNVDSEYCKKKGIEVRNTPEASTISVAELVFAHLLALSRKLVKANVSMREGKWLKKELEGFELAGKTLGIIGYGRIGKEVAKRAKAFGMMVVAHDPLVKEADIPLIGLDELVSRSDIITLHVPLLPGTKNLISGERITKMKPNAILINVARGGLVDENTLYNALKSGKLAGAGLDVFSKEPPESPTFRDLENVSLTPHLGASTLEAGERISMEVVNIIREFARR